MGSKLCGSAMEYEEFADGNGVPVEFSKPANAQDHSEKVPTVFTVGELALALKDKTADEIGNVLASEASRNSYGEPKNVMRTVADHFETEEPAKAFEIHSENWDRHRDADSLRHLIFLSFRLGRVTDAMGFMRVARYSGIEIDPVSILPLMPFPMGASFSESVLSELVNVDPNLRRPPKDSAIAELMEKSRFAESMELKNVESGDKKAELSIRLEALEFRGLTLLDHVCALNYVQLLLSLARGDAISKDDAHALLTDHAVSEPSFVSEAYYREDSGNGILGEPSNVTVSELLSRRLFHASEHFFDHRFLPFFETMRELFVELDDPGTVYDLDQGIEALKNLADCHDEFPDSVKAIKNRFLAQISAEYGSSYLPRIYARIFNQDKKFSYPNQVVGAMILCEMLVRYAKDSVIEKVNEKLFSVEKMHPDVAGMVAFAFARAKKYQECTEWLARANLEDVENVKLFLSIVKDIPDLIPAFLEAFHTGSPTVSPSTGLVLSKIRAVASKTEIVHSGEMMGDAEYVFGKFKKSLAAYEAAAEAGNDFARMKAADLLYELGRFEEAEKAYRTIHFRGHDLPYTASKLAVFALERSDRLEAAKFVSELDAEDPYNAEILARFYYDENDQSKMFKGLSALSCLPYGSVDDIDSRVKSGYEKFALSYSANLPEMKEAKALAANGSLEPGLFEMLATLRSVSIVFDRGPKDALRYFRYLDSLVREGFGDSQVGEIVFSAFEDLVAPLHHEDGAVVGLFRGNRDEEVRKAQIANLFIYEAKLFSSNFQHCAIDKGRDKKNYVNMLTSISNTLSFL